MRRTVRLAVLGQRSPTNPVAKTREGHNQQSSSWLRRKHLSLLSPLLTSSHHITPPNLCFAALSPLQGSCSPLLSQDPASSSAPSSFLSACSKTHGNSSRPGPAVEEQASALRGERHRKVRLTECPLPRLAVLSPYLPADPGLLQQVLLNLRPLDGSPFVEVDVNVLPESAGVVITDGLCVPKSCGEELQWVTEDLMQGGQWIWSHGQKKYQKSEAERVKSSPKTLPLRLAGSISSQHGETGYTADDCPWKYGEEHREGGMGMG